MQMERVVKSIELYSDVCAMNFGYVEIMEQAGPIGFSRVSNNILLWRVRCC